MQAYKRNLNEILAIDTRLVAPLFQRPYVWNQDENWEPLWTSMEEVFDRRLSGRGPQPYFLGALVLDKVTGSVGTVPAREIIDGQQRMTTLQIMMEAAKRLFVDKGIEFPARALEKLTRNDVEIDGDEKFKVWPTNVDRRMFRSVMEGDKPLGVMGEALGFFTEKLTTWLGSDDEETTRNRAAAIVDALRQDLVFVAIDLDNDDDGQLIFETLNSLGTPLLPSDLVKNLLFREALAQKIGTDELYEKHWAMFERDQEYWREEISIGRRQRTRLDIFLQFYLTLKLRKEPYIAHIFRDYRDKFRDGEFGTVVEALADFAYVAAFFKVFDQSKDGAAGDLRHLISVLDTSVPIPLVLGSYVHIADEPDRSNFMNIVESFLMRRFLCGLSTKRYNQLFAEAIDHLSKVGWSSENLRDFFLAQEGNSNVWPDDGWVIWRQQEKPAYGDIRRTGIALALSRVENHLRPKSEHLFNTRTPLTVEHLMPQKWEKHWPVDDEADRQARQDSINKIGNLTVLTKKLNSSVSNSAWEVKKGKLNDNTVLLLNSRLAQLESWDEDQIKFRCAQLGEWFCEIWIR